MVLEPSLLKSARSRRESARQRLYEVFAAYRLSEYGSPEGACGHCVSAERFAALVSTPVCDLRLEDLWSYCSAVWPGVQDFKYFLPRLLDVVEPVDPCTDWEEVERKLPREGWSACSAAERELVAEYIVAADELGRVFKATSSADDAELLRPMVVREGLASALPLAQVEWKELRAHRFRELSELIERTRDGAASDAIVTLARALNATLESDRMRADLRKKKLSVLPEDDLLMAWALSGKAEESLTSAFDRYRLDDESALCLGTALAHVAQVTRSSQSP